MVEFPAYFLKGLYDDFVTTLHWDQTLGKKMTGVSASVCLILAAALRKMSQDYFSIV